MYAVIKQGSHQYRVKPGDIIQIEKVQGEKGDTMELSDVVMLRTDDGVELGAPQVEGVSANARILRQDKSPKITVFKFKRRKGYSKKYGHRQPFTEVMITSINRNGQEL